MPDSFEHMPPVAIRMPNGALSSLAGNVDAHHRVSIADLILVQGRVKATVARLVHDLEPDVVGMSVMTFQRTTALALASFIRTLRPGVKIVVGGYDPSLAPNAYVACGDVDMIVRGEGERTLSELLRSLETGAPLDGIARLARDLPRRRQHHARYSAVRSALSRDHRQRLRRSGLRRPGDDVAHRAAWRDACAADAPRGLPLRVPRHRKRPRRGSRVPQSRGEEHP